MSWKIKITKSTENFLKKNNLAEKDINELIKSSICFFKGEDINIDIKKLKGNWLGFYRIKKGKIRIIVQFDFDGKVVNIKKIEWRGKVY